MPTTNFKLQHSSLGRMQAWNAGLEWNLGHGQKSALPHLNGAHYKKHYEFLKKIEK